MEKEILNNSILNNSKLVEELVFNISKEFTKELDSIMKTCKEIFISGTPVADVELYDLLTQIPSVIYFTLEGQETVGIREDIAEITRKNIYNMNHAKAIGTINDKNVTAESASENEKLNKIIYERCYKLIRQKIETSQEMLNSLKRMINKREQEFQFNGRNN